MSIEKSTDSNLVKGIVAEIGEMPIFVLAMPPISLLMPFFLLFWVVQMAERVSPTVSAHLAEIAESDERELLMPLLTRRQGRPFAFDLWRLKNALRRHRQESDERLAMSKIRSTCGQ